MVRVLGFHYCGLGSILGQGAEILKLCSTVKKKIILMFCIFYPVVYNEVLHY